MNTTRTGTLRRPELPWVYAIIMCALASTPCAASVINGDFSGGLTGWTTQGDVQAVTEAVIGDNGANYSFLYQLVGLSPGNYRLEFDFLNLLAADIPGNPSSFPDVFFASLFFIDDSSSFDLVGAVFDDVSPLMDLDAAGPYNVAGTLSPSGVGPGWVHLSYDFYNVYAYGIPVFELLDFNTVGGDSQVWLDNVCIRPISPVVPEPTTLTLLSVGLATCAAAYRRKSRHS